MLFQLLNIFFAMFLVDASVTTSKRPASMIREKLTGLFNSLLGKYIYTNVELTAESAKDKVQQLNWQHISYLFILLAVAVRLPFIVNYLSKNKTLTKKVSSVHSDTNKNRILLVLLFLGTFEGLYLVDKLNPSWAYLTLPPVDTVSYIGLGLGAIALGQLFYLHRTLGSSWSATVSVQKDHALKIQGPYSYARHPMYLNFLLHPIALLLMSQNWLLAAVFTPWVLYAASRVKREERLLIEEFGQTYVDYMQKVPAFGPLDKLLGRNLGLSKAEAIVVLNQRGTTTGSSSSGVKGQ